MSNERQEPCCECGDPVTWTEKEELTGAGPWSSTDNEIWCDGCWEETQKMESESQHQSPEAPCEF